MSNDNSLVTSLYQIGCIQFGEFQLKAGGTSSVYINMRKIISYPAILRQVTAMMWEILQTAPPDLVCGVPYAALPIATCLSLEHNLPLIMRRKEKKDYGTKQLIEGEFTSGQHCLIIEDIITTGSSIIETAADLENAGLVVTDVMAILDRDQGGQDKLAKKYRTHTLLSLREVLQELLTSSVLSQNEQSLALQFLG